MKLAFLYRNREGKTTKKIPSISEKLPKKFKKMKFRLFQQLSLADNTF